MQSPSSSTVAPRLDPPLNSDLVDHFYVMESMSFSKVARRKLGKLPENFRIYAAGWLGQHPNWDVMKVTGAEFRPYTRGKKKGELGMLIRGTKRDAYVSKIEMRAQARRDERRAANAATAEVAVSA